MTESRLLLEHLNREYLSRTAPGDHMVRPYAEHQSLNRM